MNQLGKIILVILLSSVKFVAGPSFAYYDQRYEFSFVETIFYCVLGGMLGVIVFTYFSRTIISIWHRFNHKVKLAFVKSEPFSSPVADVDQVLDIHYEYIEKKSEPKKIFTRRNRSIVKIWKKYGLYGIAFLTPIILSIPIGTIIANSLVDNRKKILLYMFVSLVFWSAFMLTMFEIFHASTLQDLQHKINK